MRKIALITGASSGLGKCLAIELVKKNYDLILVSRNKERLLQLRENISSRANIKIDLMTVNLSKLKEVIALIEDIRSRYSDGIDILINNAGFGNYGLLTDLKDDDIIDMMNVNLITPILMTKNLLDLLSRKKGCIVNIISMVAKINIPLMQVYVASKSGLSGFTESFRYEARKLGVRVIGVYPGYMRTSFFDNAITGPGKKVDSRISIGATEPSIVAKKVVEKIEEPNFNSNIYIGFTNKVALFVSKIAPFLVRSFLERSLDDIV